MRLAQAALGALARRQGVLLQLGCRGRGGAIKLARRKARPRGDIVVLEQGFHGRTYGALSATPQEAKQAPFAPLVPGFKVATAETIGELVDEQTAAVLIEPIQGETGILPVPDEVLQAARARPATRTARS